MKQDDKNVKKGVVDGAYQISFFIPEVLLLNKQWQVKPLASSTYLQHLVGLVLDEDHTIKMVRIH